MVMLVEEISTALSISGPLVGAGNNGWIVSVTVSKLNLKIKSTATDNQICTHSLETCKSSLDKFGYYIPAIIVFTRTGSLSFLPAIFTAVTVMK